MKIKYQDEFGNSKIKTIDRFIIDELTPYLANRGVVEELEDRHDILFSAFVQLVVLLVDKNLITPKELENISGINYKVSRFIED